MGGHVVDRHYECSCGASPGLIQTECSNSKRKPFGGRLPANFQIRLQSTGMSRHSERIIGKHVPTWGSVGSERLGITGWAKVRDYTSLWFVNGASAVGLAAAAAMGRGQELSPGDPFQKFVASSRILSI